MPSFSGSITTTGKSEAIRLDKALFRAHPEFRQRAKVRAHVIGPGPPARYTCRRTHFAGGERRDASAIRLFRPTWRFFGA